MKRLLIGCLTMLFTHAVAAQIVECVDAKGNKTFAQFCPSGTVMENKLTKGGTGAAASAPATGTKSLAERDAEFKKRALERQDAEGKSEKAKTESAAAQQNCEISRSQLKALQDGIRVTKTDPNTGERSFLDDGVYPAEIEKAQKAVASWCK